MIGRSKSGHGWKMTVDDNVLVAEFTDAAAFDEAEEINETFIELVQSDGVDATVACIEMDGSAGNKMLDGAKQAAQAGVEHGLRRWGIADPGIGKLAIKNRVDIPELDVEGFDSRDEAIRWAKAE